MKKNITFIDTYELLKTLKKGNDLLKFYLNKIVLRGGGGDIIILFIECKHKHLILHILK